MNTTASQVRKNRLARKRLRSAVARSLSQYRRTSGATLAQIAGSIGLTNPTAVKRLLDGTQTPEAITVGRIAKLCGVDMASLVNGKAKR